MNISKELDFLPDDSLLLTALIKKTYDVAKNLIDENLFTKAEIKYLEQKLKDSEKKYRIFIENFNGIAFQGYQDFPDAFFEGNVEEMTGYTEEDFTSGRIKWNEIIYPDDLERINNAVKKFYSTPINCDSREYRIIHKNGKVRWVMENIHKLYVNKKKEEIVQGNIIDITERKKA
ncbi:MAG: PAS domain-containing protein, partial [Candidatus Lokiarchaeota archaeon]|nr:PAS domain-containing protein [Candidatus Lokiarchaeota archaeon]